MPVPIVLPASRFRHDPPDCLPDKKKPGPVITEPGSINPYENQLLR